MTLDPKDQDWADPAFNKPENKILANYSAAQVIAYRKTRRYVHITRSGEKIDLSKADFEEFADDIELDRSDEDADYYRFK